MLVGECGLDAADDPSDLLLCQIAPEGRPWDASRCSEGPDGLAEAQGDGLDKLSHLERRKLAMAARFGADVLRAGLAAWFQLHSTSGIGIVG